MRLRTAILILAIFVLGIVFLVLPGCGPMLNGHAPPRPWSPKNKPMVFTVKNWDPAYPVQVKVSWWIESTIVGATTRVILPASQSDFTFAAMPDGVEVESQIWITGHGYAWLSTDYRGCEQFIVDYPQATSTRVEPK